MQPNGLARRRGVALEWVRMGNKKIELRDFAPSQNIGIMEYWNDGLTGRKNKSVLFAFNTHYSNIPSFHVDSTNRS